MRIEAQGKYLQAILEKAQKDLALDLKGPDNIEATRVQLSDFNLALSNFMENMSEQDRGGNTTEMMNDAYKKNSGSTFQIYEHGIREENKDIVLSTDMRASRGDNLLSGMQPLHLDGSSLLGKNKDKENDREIA
ncbi:protein PHR1-LIKE 2-like [Malus domestica]|uniref:protein PHR1-LIKE 2-like n=1 Tax=Malus domestica TaxID=3750 RepID=UPI003976A0BE